MSADELDSSIGSTQSHFLRIDAFGMADYLFLHEQRIASFFKEVHEVHDRHLLIA
jgi:hypothetical protein